MKLVMRELGGYVKQILLIVLTVTVTTLAILGLPSLMTKLIDEAIPTGDFKMVIHIGGLMIVLVIIGFACGIATSYLAAIVSMGVGRNLRSKVFEKVQYFSETEMDRFTASSLIGAISIGIIAGIDIVVAGIQLIVRGSFEFPTINGDKSAEE